MGCMTPLGLDGGCQFLQRARIHARARLVPTGLEFGGGQDLQLALGLFRLGIAAKERIEDRGRGL